MVFYFSGTGNSLQAAQAMLSPGEKLIDMADSLWKKEFSFHIAPGEPVGFVFPVYFGGLPVAVENFIDQLDMPFKPYYCYGLLTCGGSPAAAGEALRVRLKKKGLTMHALYTVTMPDNYVLMFKIPEPEEQSRILSKAALWLEHIKKQVDQRIHTVERASLKDRMLSAAMHPIYENDRSTKPFFSDDQCVGCGLCVKRCPAHAMVMEDGRPKWVADHCFQCMACARCGAVQYGKKTAGKKRYTNPILKKAGGHDHSAAPAGGHDHGGSGSTSGSHDHGGSACHTGEHDHSGGEECCCPDPTMAGEA